MRTEKWKYIVYPDVPGSEELYDLKTDPSEIHNLISRPEIKTVVAELQADLNRLWKESSTRNTAATL